MPTVLIARDDLHSAGMVTDILIDAGYEVCGVAHTVADGIALGLAHNPDLAIIDLDLSDGARGTDIVTRLRERDYIGVLYTAQRVDRHIELAPGDACIAKPCDHEDLLCALKFVQHGWQSAVAATGPTSE